jgi:3-hydroxyisobutyrate dehydrogenase-like beta-hydroxyacid dehydrogenase
MTGGDADVASALAPLFKPMAKSITYFGPAGT